MGNTTKLLLVDDHQILLDGLRNLLEQHAQGIEVVCATTVAAALELIAEHQDIKLALVDLYFPGVDGFALLKHEKIHFPIIIMSSTDDLNIIDAALSGGAQGFLSKGASLETLVEAIEIVLSGGKYAPPDMQKKLKAFSANDVDDKNTRICKELGLTSQNLRVLLLIAEGMSNKEIAEKLFVSSETVKSHSKQIYSVLQVNNRLSAVNEARRLGLI